MINCKIPGSTRSIFLCFFALSIIIVSCSQQNEPSGNEIFCDAEVTDGSDFLCEEVRISGGGGQSDLEAYSGKFSIRLGGEHPYGFGYTIQHPEPGQKYYVSVYCKGNGILHVKWSDLWIVKKNKKPLDGWQLLELTFIVPVYNTSEIIIFCWNPNNDNAFFDNMTIKKVVHKPNGLDKISLRVMKNDLDKIGEFRSIAKNQEMITPDLKTYFDALWVDGELETPIKIRLKGDWTDHVEKDKVSLRIKGTELLHHEMDRFSVQSPEMRNFLKEWVYHKMLEDADILTTHFDFANVEINKVNMGIYAVEEHFSPSIPKRYNRPAGVVLKKDESIFFNWLHSLKSENKLPRPGIQQSQVKEAAAWGEIAEDEKQHAINLVNSYFKNTLPLDSVFDMEKFAKFLAIIDLNLAHHSLRWHNQRWFYNIETKKLEPIGYDGFGSGDVISTETNPLIIHKVFDTDISEVSHDNYFNYHFKNEKFNELYITYMTEYSSPLFLEQFFKKYHDKIAKLEQAIQDDFPDYKYSYEFLDTNAVKIQNSLNSIH